MVIGKTIMLDVEKIDGEGRYGEKQAQNKDPTVASKSGLEATVTSCLTCHLIQVPQGTAGDDTTGYGFSKWSSPRLSDFET